MDILYRPAEISDIPQLLHMMNMQYGNKKRYQYFEWQFFNSIYKTVLIVAENAGKCIGMFGMQKRMLTNGTRVGQAIDMLVEPEYRRKGVFKTLVNSAIKMADDIDAVCVLPNTNGMKAVEGLGWKTITRINELSIVKGDEKSSKISIARKQSKNRFYYSDETIQWRFQRHPQYSYSILSDQYNNRIISKLFYNKENNKTYGDIVYFDILNCDASSDLLFLVLKKLYADKVDVISTWVLPNTTEYQLLRDVGFVEKTQERYFCLKVIKSKFSGLTNCEDWQLYQADAEFC